MARAKDRPLGEENKMAEQQIRFDDGASYEQIMGVWSRFAGEIFLDWLAPPSNLRWIDVGCGNGAFTELLVERCSPVEVQGIDPSEGQLAFARARPASRLAKFQQGDAMALPFADSSFDAAVMALVLVFVPDPARGVSEMVRVVVPGGMIATYTWDMVGGGFPLDPILAEMRALGLAPPRPPQVSACQMDVKRELWLGAGLEDVETREITVCRSFPDFEDFWKINLKSPTIGSAVAAMSSDAAETLKERVRGRLPPDSRGQVTFAARANAIRGRRPK